MVTQKPRFSITIDDKMLKEIEDYRYEHRIPTRAQAMMEIISIGMKALKENEIKNEKKD